jgi:hypothetical protein
MKYYKMVKDLGWSSFKNGIIYKENFTTQDGLVVGRLATIGLNVQDWQEVSEREYWQQELNAGRFVKGAYYNYNNWVIWKYSHDNVGEYYANLYSFNRNRGNFHSSNLHILATEDEIEWLEACNKADKFISKEEFMKNKEFVLPKQWHIKLQSQEEFDEFLKWAVINKYLSDIHLDYKAYVFPYYCGIDSYRGWYNNILNKYNSKKIGFEQFKQYLLKDNMKDRKIIGYKLIKSEYKQAVNKIIQKQTCVEGVEKTRGYFCITANCISIDFLKQAGVLDLWFEPVYEEEKILIKGYKAEINQADGLVKLGCKTFDYEDVRGVVKAINTGLNVEDADQILKLWNKIK